VTCLTLFAGAGGADVGLSRAGFTHLACVEGDNSAVATLQAAGFPAVHAWIGGPGPDGQREFQWSGCPVFLLWASPPCQPYSSLGKRKGTEDERDGWPATIAMIQTVHPTWVVIENVIGSPALLWADSLKDVYAHVQVWIANATDWGLASHRKRVYIVAGPEMWAPPAPTHYGPATPWLMRTNRSPWVSFTDAIGAPGVIRAQHPVEIPVMQREEKPIIGPAQCIAAAYCPNLGLGGQPYVRIEIDGTVHRRTLTIAECAKLVGFPHDYPFQSLAKTEFQQKQSKYRQIGNAVAPIMAQVIGHQIKVHQ